MTYFVEGLTKIDADESTVRRIGEYATSEDAINAAKALIDEFLRNAYDPEMTAKDLFSVYQQYAEVPYIFLDGDKTLNVDGFNHFKHAMVRCDEMCPNPFPTLLSDDEFEVQKQQRNKSERAENDRWDNRGIRKGLDRTDRHPESTLEQRYKQVVQRVVATWASEACSTYLWLIVSDEMLNKKYPQDVVDDLQMLYQINKLHLHK